MRVSSNTLFENAVSRISDQQSGLAKVQKQLSTGLKIQTAADDPIGAARALEINQGQAVNAQNATNRSSAKNALTGQESILQSVTDVIQNVQTQVIAANSGALSDTDRKAIATELRVRLDELTGMANSRDSVGNFMFAGFRDNAVPFNGSGAAITYAGDNGLKKTQVADGRQIAVNEPGDAVFMNIPAKSVYSGTAIGSAALSSVQVADQSQVKPGHQYDVVFDASSNYQVFDTTLDPGKTGTPAASGAYVTPQSIAVDGLSIAVTGAAAAGDTISVKPVRTQSVFKTIADLINTLEKPVATDIDRKQMVNNLAASGDNMSNALTNILSVRASGGARLQELDTLDSAGSARALQYASQLSEIQDTDYVQAITDLQQKQMMLQASQQSFVKVSGLSLFNYL